MAIARGIFDAIVADALLDSLVTDQSTPDPDGAPVDLASRMLRLLFSAIRKRGPVDAEACDIFLAEAYERLTGRAYDAHVAFHFQLERGIVIGDAVEVSRRPLPPR